MAGILGWLTYEMTQSKQQAATGPFGVPFTLTAQDGREITEKAFTGKPTALFFGFTHCPEVCPTTLFELNGWLEKVDPEGNKLQAYFITVDPERDTPDVLRNYADKVGANLAGWNFLTGTPQTIREVAKQYGVYVSNLVGNNVDHTFLTSLIDRHGTLRVQYLGVRFDPEEFRRDLLNLVEEPE